MWKQLREIRDRCTEITAEMLDASKIGAGQPSSGIAMLSIQVDHLAEVVQLLLDKVEGN